MSDAALSASEIWSDRLAAANARINELTEEVAKLKLRTEPAQPVEAAGGLAATTFICHLIDNHEGEKVTEESLQSWLAEALAHPRPTGDDLRVAPVEQERFEAWMKRSDANIRKRPDGVYADHTVMCCWNAWWMSASFKTDTSLTTVPYALADVVRAVRRFDECAEDGEDVDLSRDWFDALTTLGLLTRVQRSPARWEMTDAGHSLLALLAPTGEQAGEVVAWLYRSPAQVEFERKPTLTEDAELVRLMREAGDHEIVGLVPAATAQPHPKGVPDGWKLFPETPTASMLDAGWPHPDVRDFDREGAYADLWAAAPAPGKGGEGC